MTGETVESADRLARPGMRTIRSNFAWALAGNAVGSGCQWLLIIVLARLGTPEIVGQYALGLAITSPIFVFAGCNLRTVQATDVGAGPPLSTYLGIRMLTSLAAVTATLFVILWSSYSAGASAAIGVLACAKVLEAIADTVYGQLQQDERMDRIATSMMLRGVLAVAALATAVLATQNAAWSAASMCAASVVVLFGYDLRTLRRSGEGFGALIERLRPRGASWIRDAIPVVRVAAPMGVLMTLVSVNAYLPRYWLAHQFTEREIGLFSAIAYMTFAANMAVMALGQTASSRLARLHASRDVHGFRKLSIALGATAALLGGGSVLVAWLWGAPILEVLYGAGYGEHQRTLVWLMVGGAFSYLASACGYVMSSVRCFAPQIPLLGAATVTMLAALWVAVPDGGLTGAAIAQAAGYAVQTLLTLGLVIRVYRNLAA